jgi:hypothetical protein
MEAFGQGFQTQKQKRRCHRRSKRVWGKGAITSGLTLRNLLGTDETVPRKTTSSSSREMRERSSECELACGVDKERGVEGRGPRVEVSGWWGGGEQA